MRLLFTIDETDFTRVLRGELEVRATGVVDAVEDLLRRSLEDAVHVALGTVLVKAARAKVHPNYNKDRFATLAKLASMGFETWYPEVAFATPIDGRVEVEGVDVRGFDLGSIHYGGGVDLDHRYKRKRLKTQVNHLVRLHQVSIRGGLFRQVARELSVAQPLIANLTAGPGLVGFRLVTFDHIVEGTRVRCACHIYAHDVMRQDALKRAPSYAPDSWPHEVLRLLELPTAEAICHLCVAQRHGTDALTDWFGRSIESHKEPYIDLLMRGEALDKRTARAEVDRRLGLSRWTREADLHRVVLGLFPAARVRREASPSWLGLQRLDIYLPDLKLALEYQGRQHFRPVAHFGGEEGYRRTVERDRRKRELCDVNGVTVVYFRHDESLSRAHLKARLRRWLH